MLDTNICIYLIKEQPSHVLEHFNRCQLGDIALSTITLAELEYGAANSLYPKKNRMAICRFTRLLDVIPFDSECAQAYGQLRAELKKKGKLIGAMDLMIAAHALQEKVTLVTNNLREFKRVPNLTTQNWAKN